MFDIIVTRRNIAVSFVRPHWGEREEEMRRRMLWDGERIDEFAMQDSDLTFAGIMAPRFGAGLIQKTPTDSWLAFVGRIEVVRQLTKGPMSLGAERTEQFDRFTTWFYSGALSDVSNPGMCWELIPCGDHIRIAQVTEFGAIYDADPTRYGRSVIDSLSPDEQVGMAEVELENLMDGDMSVWEGIINGPMELGEAAQKWWDSL